MPRDGNTGVYSKPPGTTAVAGTAIESAKYNAVIDDLAIDANVARPVAVGGTGSSTADGALSNLGGTSVGRAVFKASSEGGAQDAIGATGTGKSLLTASNAGAARSTLQLPALTDNDNLTSSQNNLPTRGNVLANIGILKATDKALRLVAYADVDNGGGGTFNVAFSEGFSSVTRAGAGRYSFTFSTARANTQYMVIGNAGNNFDANFTYDDRLTTRFNVNIQNITGGTQDSRFSLLVMEPA